MAEVSDKNDQAAPNQKLSRRRLLKGLGAAGLVAAASGALLPLKDLVAAGDADAEAPNDSDIAKHQWVMVIDLRRCDGCEKCMKGCRREHNLPEGQEWIKTLELEDASGQTYYMPVPCQHCEEPPCVNVCPVGATYKVADGAVLVDQDRCIGCRMCMAACPYDARTFNWDDPPPTDDVMGEPTPEFPVPQQKGTAGKCVLCVHNLRFGKLPACVKACTMRAIYIGDLKTDLATNGKQTVKLSDLLKDNDAFHYKEELNTHPRVYYIAGHGQDS